MIRLVKGRIVALVVALALAGCAGAGALQGGEVSLPPGDSVLIACSTCTCPTATPEPTPEPTMGPAGGREYLVPDGAITIDGWGSYAHVEPGDRLLIPSTRTTKLTVRHIHGTEVEPVTVINHGGQVVISDGDWIGIEFVDCQHIQFTGTGSADEYGFVFRNATNCGVFMRAKSEYIEVDHIEIGPVGGAGIRAHSKLADVPEGWVQHDIDIHHCYVHDTKTEGAYLGNYQSDTAFCDGFHIYNNRLEDIGLEGLQFKNSANLNVHDNHFLRIGLRWPTTQGRAAINLQHDHDSEGEIFNNYIEDARRGVELNGAGPTQIHHNTIIGCGFREDGGEAIRWWGGNGMHIYQNEIRDCNDGIKVVLGRTGLIEDNIICGTVSGVDIDADTVEQRGNVIADVCQ